MLMLFFPGDSLRTGTTYKRLDEGSQRSWTPNPSGPVLRCFTWPQPYSNTNQCPLPYRSAACRSGLQRVSLSQHVGTQTSTTIIIYSHVVLAHNNSVWKLAEYQCSVLTCVLLLPRWQQLCKKKLGQYFALSDLIVKIMRKCCDLGLLSLLRTKTQTPA